MPRRGRTTTGGTARPAGAARDTATGKVVGPTVERHRSEEFRAVLDPVAEGIAPETPVQVIRDTVASHRSAAVHEGRKGRPDWTVHFTPTSASRMNAVAGSSRSGRGRG